MPLYFLAEARTVRVVVAPIAVLRGRSSLQPVQYLQEEIRTVFRRFTVGTAKVDHGSARLYPKARSPFS